MVSDSVLRALMEVAALSFVMPVVFVLVWKMRHRKSIIPSLVGVVIFVTFGMILKSVPNMLFTAIESPVSEFINNNPWVFALYAGLAAGIFEETGRFVAFKFFLAKHDYRESAIAYGLGHGGVECMIVLGFSQLQSFMYAQLINAGKMEEIYESLPSEDAVDVFKNLVESILHITVSECVWAGIERLSAIIIQVSLSIVVYKAVRIAGYKHYLVIAIVLHTFIDVFAALYQQGLLSLVTVEVIIIIYALAVAGFAYRIYYNLPHDDDKDNKENKKNWGYAAMKYNNIDTSDLPDKASEDIKKH